MIPDHRKEKISRTKKNNPEEDPLTKETLITHTHKSMKSEIPPNTGPNQLEQNIHQQGHISSPCSSLPCPPRWELSLAGSGELQRTEAARRDDRRVGEELSIYRIHYLVINPLLFYNNNLLQFL